ncbi:MAG: hypothetical protein ACRCZC_01435 [Culicoidibacterales bacterium]
MMNTKTNINRLILLDFFAHLLVYVMTFVTVRQLLDVTWFQAYQQFQQLPIQPVVTYGAIFGVLQVVSLNTPPQKFAMLDYVLDVGMMIIPVIASVVGLLVAAQSGLWYMWLVAIAASISHLTLRVQLPKRTDSSVAPAPTSFVSLAAIAYVGSYSWLAFTYMLS